MAKTYRLSEIHCGEFTVAGYSVAGEESIICVGELDVVFDIGRAPRECLAINHVLLTHGHMDHSAGIAYYFSQRDFQGIKGGTALVPVALVRPLKDLMAAWAKVEGHPSPHTIVGMTHGENYEIRRNLVARAFDTRHVGPTLGFTVIDVRQKLHEQYLGLSSPEIVALKNKGVEITRRLEVPLVTYMGDTARSNYSDLPHVRDSKVLLIECTFFEDDHIRRARLGKHLHVTDLGEVLEGMNNEKIILTHVTRRTFMAHARQKLKQTLKKEQLDKIVFLMGKRQVEEE